MSSNIGNINALTQINQLIEVNKTNRADDTFKFKLSSAIDDVQLQQKIQSLMEDITTQGERISRHMDIRDLKRYRGLIAELLNEVVYHSYEFSRENFLDRHGRHRVYGMTRRINEKLDELAEELLADEQDHLAILQKIGEIEGMLLDILA